MLCRWTHGWCKHEPSGVKVSFVFFCNMLLLFAVTTGTTYFVGFRDGSYLWLSMSPTGNIAKIVLISKTITMLPTASFKKNNGGMDMNHPLGKTT